MANWGRNFLHKFRNKLKNYTVRVEQLRLLMRKGILPSCWRMKSCIGSSELRLFDWRTVTLQASGRKAANKVSSLVDVNGIVQLDLSTMGSIALSYFLNLFSSGLPNFDGLEILLTDVVSLEENESLVAPFSKRSSLRLSSKCILKNRRVLMV